MIKDKLKEIRESVNMNKKEFSNYIGVKYTTYNGYETGSREPDSDFLVLIAKTFDVSTDYILGLNDEKEIAYSYQLKSSEFSMVEKYRDLDLHGKDMVDTVLEKETERIKNFGKLEDRQIISLIEIAARRESTRILPYWENGVSAGNGIYQLNDTSCVMMHLWATELTKQADFIIKVSGSSMEPDYHDGDKVLVDRKVNVNIGEVGIFVRNGETYIKELGIGELISRNPEYENIPVRDFDNVVCMGKVIGVLTDSMVAKE